jgi:hypothetical protein
MAMKVKLSDIVEALEFQNDETEYYLDTATGIVHLLGPDDLYAGEEDDPIEDYPEWQRPTVEIARRLTNGEDENLIELPTQWDVNEYRIMEAFCDALPEGAARDSLCTAIHGKGAFRRFKDTAQALDVFKEWHRFRLAQFRVIAIEWCQDNEIAYVDDTEV